MTAATMAIFAVEIEKIDGSYQPVPSSFMIESVQPGEELGLVLVKTGCGQQGCCNAFEGRTKWAVKTCRVRNPGSTC